MSKDRILRSSADVPIIKKEALAKDVFNGIEKPNLENIVEEWYENNNGSGELSISKKWTHSTRKRFI